MSQAAVGFGGHPLVSALAAVDSILDGVSDTSLWSLSDGQVAGLVAEAQLVRWAGQFDPGQLGKLGRRIAQVVDPGAGEACEARRLAEWERRAFRRRELVFADDGRGTVFVRGRMDVESATIVRRAGGHVGGEDVRVQ